MKVLFFNLANHELAPTRAQPFFGQIFLQTMSVPVIQSEESYLKVVFFNLFAPRKWAREDALSLGWLSEINKSRFGYNFRFLCEWKIESNTCIWRLGIGIKYARGSLKFKFALGIDRTMSVFFANNVSIHGSKQSSRCKEVTRDRRHHTGVFQMLNQNVKTSCDYFAKP